MTRAVKIFSLIFFLSASLFAQVEFSKPKEKTSPQFSLDAINYAAPDAKLSRLDVYVKISYAELQFIKKDKLFECRTEINASLYDSLGQLVQSKNVSYQPTTSNFDLTNSKSESVIGLISLVALPGQYKLKVEVTDQESRDYTELERIINLQNYSQWILGLSDLLFADEVEMNEAGWAEKILPSVDNIYHGKNKPFFVYYEIYNTAPRESLSVDYQIVDSKNKIIFRKHLRILTTRNYFADSFALDGTDLPPDQFTLILQIRQKERSTTRSKHFFVQWRGIPKYITDLRVAAEQMVYLLGAEELRKWREANDQQLKEYFLTFWQKQDPTPETEENERVEEHFRRVAYANQNFKVLKREGWRTDRGMVYIKYGTPDEVDRQPFSGGYKPYEIWYYNERRFRIVFIDETGFGDYRIAN